MLFSSKISQTRPAVGCAGALKRGNLAAVLCYGYRVVRSLKDGVLATGDCEVFVEEAAIVQRIFRDYASGTYIGGRIRKVLMQAPKNGFFYVLDRLSGELLSAEPFVPVTWATSIDMKTGRPVEAPRARYGTAGALISPSTGGAHNWQPMAFDPSSGLVFIPARVDGRRFQMSSSFTPKPRQLNIGIDTSPAPQRPTTVEGLLIAWDPVAQRERWRVTTDGIMNGGVLATAGGLVFNGTQSGRFRAHDALTGTVLWEVPLKNRPATPVTYQLDGRQYVTIAAGVNADARIWTFRLAE